MGAEQEYAFRASELAVSPKFPAWAFRSHDEFLKFLSKNQGKLDARHLYQLTLATRQERHEVSGVCAACLAPTDYSSIVDGELLNDGRRMPNWREGLRCGCARRLNNRQRAVIHFAQACGLLPWMESVLIGATENFALAYMDVAPRALCLAHFSVGGGSEVFAAESKHFIVSTDEFQFVDDSLAAFARCAAALVPGGRCIFTVPFHVHDAHSVMKNEGGVGQAHQFGWDILKRLQEAGFRDVSALLYWSEELGYLGNMNFIFLGIK
ncbi:hypothetical protein [Acidocella facilis]|uniref:hypothetical protein n=1 Tax=Acidocella facilis TaxID=525 RepID=UPI001F24F199|nr:hypothetical protein [Acidocella facilis]